MIKKYFNFSFADRTQKANLNTILSVFFRGGSILLQFALIPLTINYINPNVYGVWLTLSSLVGWVAMFDIGIANGLKNKLSESLSLNDYAKARIYVSTTYVIIGLIAVVLIIIYLMLSPLVNWQSVFNSKFIEEKKLANVMSIVSIFFLLKFVTDIINVVSASFQMVSISALLVFTSNLFLTLSVWLLLKTTKPDLLLLAIFLSAIPFIVSLLANFYLFKKNFKSVRPSTKFVDFRQSKSIVSLGSQFFILQIISLIIFQTDNILIAQLFNPSDVTDFNIAYKYYSIVTIVFSIILAPYWPAFTDAYQKKDFHWIRKAIQKLCKYWIISILLLGIMVFLVNYVVKLWLGREIIISTNLSISICLYVIIANWSSIFASFLNGIGKIRIQIYFAFIAGALNIPVCFFLVKILGWGTYAMPASNFICLIFGAIVGILQYSKIIKGTATGVWNK